MNTFAFLTTTPNNVVKPVHPNRMPVTLREEDEFRIWLHGNEEVAIKLAKPLADDILEIVRQGPKSGVEAA